MKGSGDSNVSAVGRGGGGRVRVNAAEAAAARKSNPDDGDDVQLAAVVNKGMPASADGGVEPVVEEVSVVPAWGKRYAMMDSGRR